MDKIRFRLEIWLRCKKSKKLTRHTRSLSDNPEQIYKCLDCGEKRKL